jgi:N6-L-threonylcarbamoyladenine synthase
VEGPRAGAGKRLILGIETSCDETAAALVTEEGEILSNVVSSQADLHARYGGVVPEVASRRHLELVTPVLREALDQAGAGLADVERVAVTRGPGLIGALLVGLSAAKALAWALRLPLVPVDHLHGHVASLFLAPDPVEPPFLCLLASGGHTLLLDVRDRRGYSVLGTTLDDAAGEAFDKGARLLGLGYPGGAAIDRLAREGDPEAFDLPVARVPGLDFSFSGLKTALLYKVRELGAEELERRRADLAASYQRAIVRALVERVTVAAEQTGSEQVAVVGGVAANSELRASLPGAALAPLELCTDNAAMIASAGRYVEELPLARYLALDAYASSAA